MTKKMSRSCVWLITVFMILLGSLVFSSAVSLNAEAATLKSQAGAIIKKQTKTKDSKKVKLKKLFAYTQKNWGYKRVTPAEQKKAANNAKGWTQSFAKTMLGTKAGSCYHFAAGYGVLARQATGYQVRVGVGKSNGFGSLSPHAWTEVKIGSTWYVCDANLDKFAAKSSGKYYLKKRTSLKRVYNNYKDAKYAVIP